MRIEKRSKLKKEQENKKIENRIQKNKKIIHHLDDKQEAFNLDVRSLKLDVWNCKAQSKLCKLSYIFLVESSQSTTQFKNWDKHTELSH